MSAMTAVVERRAVCCPRCGLARVAVGVVPTPMRCSCPVEPPVEHVRNAAAVLGGALDTQLQGVELIDCVRAALGRLQLAIEGLDARS